MSGLRPHRVANAAALWLVIGWCIARMTARRSITRAVCGMCSQTRSPGTLVAIEPNSPRTSAGAFGFMSTVSMWLGPP